MEHNRNLGSIPDRWLQCPRKASGMIAGKFLAFKTPLDKRYNSQMSPQFYWHPSMVFSIMESYKVKLGLWIDLTNTTRFYRKEDVEELGAKYEKLSCRGHGETPSEDQARTFIDICDKFIRTNPLKTIGVHCTHGFNRTGFLIISYMVEKMDISVDAALLEFSKVREPGIYKADYIKELFQRYDDGAQVPLPPEMPKWSKEFDDDEEDGDGEDSDDSNSGSSSAGNTRRNRMKKNPVFMEGVPGVKVVGNPRKKSVQEAARKLCDWKKKGFPGSQPVSMDKRNINLLKQKPYRVSWKADGTRYFLFLCIQKHLYFISNKILLFRYMMLILRRNEVFFLDRDNSVFQVANLHFPMSKDIQRHIESTLLDGEMVIDTTETGERVPRYLVYDIISLNGQDVKHRPFYPDRYNCIKNEIVDTRISAMMKGLIKKDEEPFSVRRKEFWELTVTAYLLSDRFAKKLSHEPDGLIFQPSKDPYHPGQCPESLKWKPLSHNSVDFRLKIDRESGPGILPKKICRLYCGGKNITAPYASMKYKKDLKDMDNKIVECKWYKNQWEFMRERTDKSFPNSYETATSVVDSIANPVTQENLLQVIEHERWRKDDKDKDTDLMPPPSKIRRS